MSSTISYDEVELLQETTPLSDEEEADAPEPVTRGLAWTEPEAEGIFPGFPFS